MKSTQMMVIAVLAFFVMSAPGFGAESMAQKGMAEAPEMKKELQDGMVKLPPDTGSQEKMRTEKMMPDSEREMEAQATAGAGEPMMQETTKPMVPAMPQSKEDGAMDEGEMKPKE